MADPVTLKGRPLVASLLLLVPLLAAPRPSPAEEPGVADRSRSSYVDSVDVNQVNVEVLVTGRKGRRIVDLGRDDFELFEDGRRVEITHFRAPKPLIPRAAATAEPPRPETGREPPPPAEALEPPSYLLLFVDTLNLRPRHRRQLFEALRESLSREPGSPRLMLVTYDGRLRVRHGFDSSTEEVLATLAGSERGRLAAQGESERRAAELAAAAAELRAAEGGSAQDLEAARSRRDSALAELAAYAESESQEILRTLDVLRQLVFSLGGIAGRKSILYAGDNLTMAPASELQAAAANAFGGQVSAPGATAPGSRGRDLYRDFEGLVRQANASGVSIYTLTPPSHGHLGDVTVASAGPPGFQSAIRSEREARIKEAVCLISHTTGGRCQSGGTDFSLLIDGTLEDLETLYSLGYVPDRTPDGKFHRIEVRVKRRGLETRHREGYVDRTADDRLRERLAAALWFDAEENQLGVELVLEEQTPLGKRGRFVVPVQMTVPAESFALLPSADPDVLAARGRILIVAAAANGRLTVSEEIPLSFEVDAARLAAGVEPAYSHRLRLQMGRGNERIALGVWDEIGRRGSFMARSLAAGDAKPAAAAASGRGN